MSSSFVFAGSVVLSSGTGQKTSPTRIVFSSASSAASLTQQPLLSSSAAPFSRPPLTVSSLTSPSVTYRSYGCDIDVVGGVRILSSMYYGTIADLYALEGGDVSGLVWEVVESSASAAAAAPTADVAASATSSITRTRTKQLPRKRLSEGRGILDSTRFAKQEIERKRLAAEQSSANEDADYDSDDDDDDSSDEEGEGTTAAQNAAEPDVTNNGKAAQTSVDGDGDNDFLL